MDPPSDLFSALMETSTCSLNGCFPARAPRTVACVLLSGVRAPAGEIPCVALSTLRRLLERGLQAGWTEVLRVLFQDLDLMTYLVELFGSEDQVVSYLAARTSFLSVCYLLRDQGGVSPVWQRKCIQTFQNSSSGPDLDSCLCSLTEIQKKLLKEKETAELVGSVSAAFSSSLSVLCSRLLPEDQIQSSRVNGTSVCLLMDLLEVSGSTLIQTHCSGLLKTVSWSSQYYVKKRALLLLKRVLVQRLGEDWSLQAGPVQPDLAAVAQCVLEAVEQGWLQSIQVDQGSYFGGTRTRGTTDGVVLRSVSLIVLRSIQVQRAADAVQTLWDFLKQKDQRLTDLCHSCCWIGLLFLDQDDDLMEAAKTCLALFLMFRENSDLLWNPHCHFVLLLHSFAFDHTILLDFLISMETCFLEYLVCYLKFLREDWNGFTEACRAIGSTEAPHAGSAPGLHAGSAPGLHAGSAPGLHAGSAPGLHAGSAPGLHAGSAQSSLGSGLRLVCYDSSDDSDPEDSDGQTGRTALDLLRGSGSSPVLDQVVLCLSELREVVKRLQEKNLFPYNPSSLLRLLSQLDQH